MEGGGGRGGGLEGNPANLGSGLAVGRGSIPANLGSGLALDNLSNLICGAPVPAFHLSCCRRALPLMGAGRPVSATRAKGEARTSLPMPPVRTFRRSLSQGPPTPCALIPPYLNAAPAGIPSNLHDSLLPAAGGAEGRPVAHSSCRNVNTNTFTILKSGVCRLSARGTKYWTRVLLPILSSSHNHPYYISIITTLFSLRKDLSGPPNFTSASPGFDLQQCQARFSESGVSHTRK